MNAQPASLKVAVAGRRVFIRISGRATFNSSPAFKTLMLELWGRGHQEFVLDLQECAMMDSTFLGVLSGLSQSMSEGDHPATLNLVRPSQRILDQLDNLGIRGLFPLAELVDAPGEELKPVEAAPATKTDLNRTSLEAHRLLVRIHPGNISKFKDVIRYLEEDLKESGG